MHNFIASITPIATPQGGPGSGGFAPATILGYYGINQITFKNASGTTITGDGSGQTIAIVDGFADPNITSELATFDAQFGIAAPPSFKVVNQTGGSTLPSTGAADDVVEIALDVEWAHAAAPGANIVLLEANSLNNTDLLTAVDTAANMPGVVAVSMSWGNGEYNTEMADDSNFVTPSGHQGVVFIASSGDDGGVNGPSWPAISPGVVGVGGTFLQQQSNGSWVETAWSGSGGGISAYEAQPSYQNGVVTQSSSMRTSPDVAYDGSPSSGVDVYTAADGWIVVGGTSAGAPQWAGLTAIIDQGRAATGIGSIDGGTQFLPAIYAHTADFHQITSGSNAKYSAGPGYNLVTGLGTPIAPALAADLIAYGSSSSSGSAITNAAGGNVAGTAGSALSGVVATFSDSNPNAAPGDFNATINWGDGNVSTGAVTISGGVFYVSGSNTYHQYGNYSVSVTITSTADGDATITGAAAVADAPISANGILAQLPPGDAFTSVIGTFADGNPFAATSQFTITILWGDGTTSAGTALTNPNGGFEVVGSHDYQNVGTFTATFTINSGGGSQATAASVFTVSANATGSTGLTGGGSGSSGSSGSSSGGGSASGSSGSSSTGAAVTPAPAAPPVSDPVALFGNKSKSHKTHKVVFKHVVRKPPAVKHVGHQAAHAGSALQTPKAGGLSSIPVADGQANNRHKRKPLAH